MGNAFSNGEAEPAQVQALSRLVLSGWTGNRIGDPVLPSALVYMVDRGGFTDALLVTGPSDAVATRKTTLGTTVRNVRGTVAEVVAEVLTW